jgi:hypothetical protein
VPTHRMWSSLHVLHNSARVLAVRVLNSEEGKSLKICRLVWTSVQRLSLMCKQWTTSGDGYIYQRSNASRLEKQSITLKGQKEDDGLDTRYRDENVKFMTSAQTNAPV